MQRNNTQQTHYTIVDNGVHLSWATSPWTCFNQLGPLGINGQLYNCKHLQCSNGFATCSIGFRRSENLKIDSSNSENGLQLIQACPPLLVALGFFNLQSGKNTFRIAPMPLQLVPSCSEHKNTLGMTLLEPKLVEIRKIYASFNFPYESPPKLEKLQSAPPNLKLVPKMSEPPNMSPY